MPAFPIMELELIHITVDCFANPQAEIDLPLVQEELDEQIALKQKLFKACYKYFPEIKKLKLNERLAFIAKQLSSNNKFALALESVNIEPPLKVSPSDEEKLIFAFAKDDLEFQALAKHKRAAVRNLIKARMLAKSPIGETRARRMLLRGTTGNKKLPLLLNYGKARTLRWTGGDKFNPQNFPAARGGNKGRLRKAIIAPKGYRIVVVDSSQIEARMNAWLWGQEDLLHVFATGGDPYADLATSIYGFEVTDKKSPERFVGKVGVLGLGYQMGAPKFQLTLEKGSMGPPMIITDTEAQVAVKAFRRKNAKIVAGWRFLENMLAIIKDGGREYEYKNILRFRKGAIDTISGFNLIYPDVRADWNSRYESYENYTYRISHGRTNIYGGKLCENIVQHLARLVVAEQMVDIAQRYKIITMTHDEVVYLATERGADRAYKYGLKCMRRAPAWCPDIPLDAEGGFANNYSK